LEKESQSSARTLRIAVCLVVAAFLNTRLQLLSPWLGYIDWLMLVTLYVGLLRDPFQALMTATVAGILQDGLSGSRFGISGIAHLLAVWVAFQISSRFFVEGLLVRIPITAGAILIYLLTRVFLYHYLGFQLPPVMEMNRGFMEVFFGVFINLLASLLFYALLDRFFRVGFRQRFRRAEAMRGLRRSPWNRI
jgi:rod shape-determining protein MreD